MTLDYSGWAVGVRGLGPGRRVVLWVRGCRIGCPGCMTPELWASGEPRPIAPLAEEILAALEGQDGLTISGGEPFEQPEAVAALIRAVRARSDVEVLSYSGFRHEALLRRPEAAGLLSELDMLIDGPYRQGETNRLQWRGSDNQRVLLLSPRARDRYEADAPAIEPRELSLQALGDGRVRIVGIPRAGEFPRIRAALAAQGLAVGDGR